MEQFEQLLTCAICLDRYRNPKLLPCQHSFCMEPCMDGLVDYVRRQVKCPECRAEHRIPYQGVQGYPTNVTLQRFLELHIEITGELPDPTSGQIMERCNVCSEKSYCSMCFHCDKKICGDCKGAHMDILRREISRINNQVRRGLHRLQDMLAVVEKNMLSLQQNCSSVTEEVDEIDRRLSKALKDRTEFLRGEVDKYLSTEIKNLSTLKENLEQEISNIQSNCDLADKHMTEAVDWDDCELMDAKEIFLKTVDFIRNFECENTDYNRRMRFAMAHDPNQLVLHVAGYGELTVHTPHQPFSNNPQGIVGSGSSTNLLQPPGPGLMRSKSDHRLTSQFRQQEERGYGDRYGDGDESIGPPRKFGERYSRQIQGSGTYGDRYGRQDYGSEFESPYDSEPRRSSYRSRFRRDRDNDSDNDGNQMKSVRFSEPQHKERERVLDTEDVARGPLSGITRLYDSPRVMQRIAEIGKEKKKPEPKPEPPTQKFQAPKKTQRQVSEEDEITRIKKQNKQGGSDSQSEARPTTERVQALKRGTSNDSEERSSPSSPREEPTSRKTPPVAEVPSSEGESEEEDEEEVVSSLQNKPTSKLTSNSANASRRSSVSSELQTPAHKKAGRSASSDSTTSSESSHGTSTIKTTGAAYTTEEVKQKILARGSIDKGSEGGGSGTSSPRGRLSSTGSDTAKKDVSSAPKFQSRFLNRQTSEKPKPTKEEDEETESSSETETDSDEESEDDKRKVDSNEMDKTDIARSAQARDSASSRRESRDEGTSGFRSRYGHTREQPKEEVPWRTRYGHLGGRDEDHTTTRSRYGQDREEAPRFLTRNRQSQEEEPKFGGYTSRFLNKSKSTAAVSPDEDSDRAGSRKYSIGGTDEESKYSSGRSRYSALKDRKNSITKSRSSHNFTNPEEDEDDDISSSSSYLSSKYGQSSINDISRSRSSHHLKSRENSPDRPNPGREKDGAALSSWARYLKNKYGNRGKDGKDTVVSSTPTSSAGASTSSLNSRRLSLGLPLRHNSASFESSDDDQKNTLGSPTSPTATAAAGFVAAAAGSTLRNQYLQKRRQQFKIGSRGSEPGSFTWPRGIAVGSDNSIIVADSSNHRVQVFDSNGNFSKEFGNYGNGEGEFDCLAGVAVNRIGQFIIADRYNHRIQVLDPSGRFLRAFGSQGTGDGRFNYPWGITTDALGFIYVCDKENHRVQVFQSDGTFVGKFGSHGNKPGQLEHPHYIAVSNTNRVIVSDSNNHRVQIFDVNGRVLSSFGNEGSEEGQFKFPRGVAVDDQGYIIVGDSGNNRIQIFHPDGTFLRAFGCWGSGDGEFKGLEGVAVMSNGNILVCDRENHRIQVF